MEIDLNRHKPSKQRRLFSPRLTAVVVSFGFAFILNDITAVESMNLNRMGMEPEAKVLGFTPLILLALWIAITQYWISVSTTVLGWEIRVVGLYLVSAAIFGAIWLYAFRNIETLSLPRMPSSEHIQMIEAETTLPLSCYSDATSNHVRFDNSDPGNKQKVLDALQEFAGVSPN